VETKRNVEFEIKPFKQGAYVGKHLSFVLNGKVLEGNAIAANRTREIRPSGMRGGLAETWAMGVGLRPIGKQVDKPPNPKAARAALLPDLLSTSLGPLILYLLQ